ncbi:MAG: N4-gp56 family major capsid protein [Oscillospiraceae bacterium]|nr:N4-gp56 family major capsid protein [Oscillospiraceae bacterium]
MERKFKINTFEMNLQLFAGNLNTNVTTQTGEGQDLSPEMKTFYSKYLIDTAEPKLVHDQFAQKHDIPKNGGKTIEFRKYDSLPKATTPLVEGVTPDGRKLSVTKIEATVDQFGDYITLSDMLILTAIDNNLVQATKLLGSQSGRTLDTITREVINGGTNVQYANGEVTSREALTVDHKLTVAAIKRAVRFLKAQNAETIDGDYVAIIHPDTEYDIMNDDEWMYANMYAGSTRLFEGEIGKIAGVRFVSTTEAKIFPAATSSGKDVYSTLVLGDNAYGTTGVEGGGLQHIVKQLGSGGTADPLNQRATVGWKAVKTAVRLVEPYMVRIETCSTFDSGAN